MTWCELVSKEGSSFFTTASFQRMKYCESSVVITMSTMTEEFTCSACKQKGAHVHACQVPIKKKKMTLADIKKLVFFCASCGRVSETKDGLCQPVALNEKDKAKFVKAGLKSSDVETCEECGQPVSPPGHACNPKGLPYTCEYCGERVQNYHHMCKQIVEKAKFTCKNCGRIAVKKESLCAPIALK
jgi:hypothetical protein